jgi:hypothetical protein
MKLSLEARSRRSRRGCKIRGRRHSTLGGMLREYIESYRPQARRERSRFRRFSSLEKAIETAALALDEDKKRSAHHRRRTAVQLSLGKSALIASLSDLRRCKSFDQLHNRVRKATKPIKGLGKLYTYDTTQLIGAHLRLSPKRVYLHSGTRNGARALGFSGGLSYLMPSQLPIQLQVLKPYEMEDFLCIFERDLARLRRAKRKR